MRPAWARYVGFGMIAIAVGLAAWFAVGLVVRDVPKKSEREPAERDLREKDETVRRSATDSSASVADDTIQQTTFHQARQEVFDGQCRGKGAPPFGYIVDGGTYAQNRAAARQSACIPFGAGENITNIFCCPSRDLQPVLNPGHEP